MFNKKYKEQIKQLEAINQQLNNKISEQSIQLAIEKSARSELTKKIIELQEKKRILSDNLIEGKQGNENLSTLTEKDLKKLLSYTED